MSFERPHTEVLLTILSFYPRRSATPEHLVALGGTTPETRGRIAIQARHRERYCILLCSLRPFAWFSPSQMIMWTKRLLLSSWGRRGYTWSVPVRFSMRLSKKQERDAGAEMGSGVQ